MSEGWHRCRHTATLGYKCADHGSLPWPLERCAQVGMRRGGRLGRPSLRLLEGTTSASAPVCYGLDGCCDRPGEASVHRGALFDGSGDGVRMRSSVVVARPRSANIRQSMQMLTKERQCPPRRAHQTHILPVFLCGVRSRGLSEDRVPRRTHVPH